VRTLGARQGSTPRLTFRRRLAAAAALCIATTTAAVVGASVPALANVSTSTVTLSRNAAGALSTYTISFSPTIALVAATDTITLVASSGTVFPAAAGNYTVADNAGAAVTAATTSHVSAHDITITVPAAIAAADTVTVVASGVTNPAASSPTLTVATSKEATPVASAGYTIAAATAVTGVVVSSVSPAKASSTTAQYTIQFAVATLLNANDTITLSAPTGTVFPLVLGDYLVTAGGTQTLENLTPTQTALNNVTLNVPAGSTGAGTPLFVHALNVTNPSTPSAAEMLTVSTSADTTVGTSPPYTISALTAVSGVTVTATPPGAALTSNYTVGFTAATALVVDAGTITIVGPGGTVFPLVAADYTVNGIATTATPTGTAGNVTLTTHVAVPAGPVIVVATGVTNPAAGSRTLTVATSEDSTATTSAAYAITVVTGVTVTAAPSPAGAVARYTVGFTATSALAAGTGTITIVGPIGTVFQSVAADYTINGTAVTTTPTGSGVTVVLTMPVSIGAAGTVNVVAIGVTNPAVGSQTLTVKTSADGAATSSAYAIAAAGGTQVTAITASPSPATTGVAATYTVVFHATTAVTITTGTITIVGPSGTVFPSSASAYTINTIPVVTATPGAASVTLNTPVAITAAMTVAVVASGVTNPAVGLDNLTVATTTDVNPLASPFYAITAVVSGGGGGPAPTIPTTPVRLSGSDRFGTAIAASAAEFPTAGTAGAVVLARSDDYPDALVGAALAAAKNAPLLFANGGVLTPATQAEIQRVLPAGGTVFLLGGTTAIPASVATSLTSLGFVPVRYAGADRFATALAVADALNDPSTVLLATGVDFPDALAAGPAAAHVHGVVLLTNGSSLTPAVTTYLATHPGTVYAIGGPAVAADPSATALSGADRYATAAMVASSLFTTPTNVGVASGTAFPDALSGGAFQAHFGGPIVLTDPHILPASTSTYLTGAKTTLVTTRIFGGTTALSAVVQTAIGTALGL
jgi:putative cell wall-binding protein